MIKNVAALALAATLGAGVSSVISTTATSAAPKYQVHAADIRELARLPDGGLKVSVTVYGKRQLLDGGYKDMGTNHLCTGQKQIDAVGAALLRAAEVCIKEDL